MFTQPSVNQIASTYQGNPAPLARKVDQDKKQNGGIPQDLRQLLALNDITEGRNAMGIQQALQIPTNMPTVAQDLQERARQALQARQMQAMQEMMRKNGQPNMVPPGTPRPPMQAQGLNSLRTNVGEGYAHGGIIGFNGTSSQFVQDVAQLPQAFDDLKQRIREEDAIKAAQDRRMAQRKQEALEARQKTSFFNYLFGTPAREKEGEAALAQMSATPLNAPEKPPAVAATPLANIRGQLNAADTGIRALPGTPPPPRVNPNTQAQTRVNAVAPEQPSVVTPPVAPAPAQTEAYKIMSKEMRRDPEVEAQALRAKRLAEVGSRDLSIYDQMAEELKARKERLNAPKKGYDATMELLEQIAMGGGRNWMEAGSRGAAAQKALQKSRLSEQDILMEKILDLGAKKAEAQYAEKKEMFDFTQAEKKNVYDKAYQAAKSVNASDDEAKKIAAQAVENELNRKAQAAENEKLRLNQIRAAQIGAQDRDNLMSRARALMAADPTKKMTLEQAMQRAGEIGNAGQMESADVRRLAAFNAAKDKIDSKTQYISMLLDKKNDPKYAQLRQQYAADIRQARLDAGLPALGINALPSAGGPTSSNIRSQADAIISGGR